MLTKTIPSYLYVQYNDDPNLQAFVRAYNTMSQEYIDWFNWINLPVYTSGSITGTLLDWVAQGIYGMTRPSLPLGHNVAVGPYNTYAFNTLAFNTGRSTTFGGPTDPSFFTVSDDIFKRILTWHFFKGDGKYFNIRWLKRRIMRFLYGVNGVNYNVDQTYQISVTFGIDNQVNIRLITNIRTPTTTAAFNSFAFNTRAFNQGDTSNVVLTPIPDAETLASAIESGALELPFQFRWVVVTT